MTTAQKIRIPSYSVDEDKRLRLTAFMEYAQQAAEDDCEAAGFGNRELLAKNCAWVLVGYHIVIGRMPLFKDTATIATWNSKVEGPIFRREYEMRTENGELLLSACTTSCILNLGTRRPVRPKIFGITDGSNGGRQALETPPERLRIPEGISPDLVSPRVVTYSDVDYNRHVNNVRYVQWALDCLSDADRRQVGEITVNYKHEIPPHSEVIIRRYHCPDRIFVAGEFNSQQAFLISFSAKK